MHARTLDERLIAASVGDTIQIAYDPENNKAWIGLNNTWYSSSGATTGCPTHWGKRYVYH